MEFIAQTISQVYEQLKSKSYKIVLIIWIYTKQRLLTLLLNIKSRLVTIFQQARIQIYTVLLLAVLLFPLYIISAVISPGPFATTVYIHEFNLDIFINHFRGGMSQSIGIGF